MTRRTLFRLLVAFTLVWAGWAVWSLLGRSHPYEMRVLDDLGSPIASAVIDSDGSQIGTTGDDGRVDLVWSRNNKVLGVSAPGHIPRMVTLSDLPEGHFDVVLKARVLRGQVVDSDGDGVEGATVTAGRDSAMTDSQGYFQLRGAEEGTVQVTRPAWLDTSFEWEGGAAESIVEIQPFTARAVHIGGSAVRDEFEAFVQMAMDTELNALMIDLKDETGKVFFDTTNQIADEAGAAVDAFSLQGTVSRAHELGLYVIGRIVLFNDPLASKAHPEMAVWDAATDSPYEANGQFFLDPTDPDARQYGIDLAIEACQGGVDEIQFDYIRFPDKRTDSAQFDGGVDPDTRMATVSGFLSEAVNKLRPIGCAVAADIFGYLTTAQDDGGIGQRWEDVANIVDVVSPMVYPSHYDADWYGFANPSEFPGEMVDRALGDGFERSTGQAIIRPWLQDFGYEASSVRAQIEAAESYGLGWMLWNAASQVTVDALEPAE